MAASEKLNEKYIVYQILAQNLESLKQQMQLVEQQLFELNSALMSLEDLHKMDDQNEIFLPLGGGCFGKGKITENDKILVNVGSGIFLDENTEGAKKLLQERLREIERAGKEIEDQAEKIALQMNELAAEIQKMAQMESKKS
jgi:prefoldin alpha subunit